MKYKHNTTLSIKDLVLLKQNPKLFLEKEMGKSYSHKPHLADLPYDRRSNDPDELQERIDEINTRIKANDRLIENEKKIQKQEEGIIKELEDEIEKYENNISSLELAEKQFETYDKEMQKEGLDSIQSIVSRFEEECPDLDHATIDGKPNLIYLDMHGGMNEMFEYGGLINSLDAQGLNDLAGKLVDYAYDKTGGDDTPWSNRVIGIADDIRALARKHDINQNKNGGDFAKELEDSEDTKEYFRLEIQNDKIGIEESKKRLAESKKEKSRLERENKDYRGERKNTEDKLKELKD